MRKRVIRLWDLVADAVDDFPTNLPVVVMTRQQFREREWNAFALGRDYGRSA